MIVRLLAEAGAYSSTLLLDNRPLVCDRLCRTNVADELFYCNTTSVSKEDRLVYKSCGSYGNSSCGRGGDDPVNGVARQVLVQGQQAVAPVDFGARLGIVCRQRVGR